MKGGVCTMLRGEHAVGEAADAISSGRVVALPMETVYALVANASSGPAMERLAGLTGGPNDGDAPIRTTWHAPTTDDLLDHAPITHDPHRRLIGRLSPGPARYLIEADPAAIDRFERSVGAVPGVFRHGGAVAARVQANPLTAEIFAGRAFPSARWGWRRRRSATVAQSPTTCRASTARSTPDPHGTARRRPPSGSRATVRSGSSASASTRSGTCASN